MATVASWYHCSVKPVSRSAGRSVVAAAAYRLGERLQDERYAVLHDYTRRRGVESAFTLAPAGAPEWALTPERLWNEAEKAETRKNSTLAREVELALPACLSPQERQAIAREFAAALVDRYGVAVSAAIHSPGKGDERNFHAHILFTTREMTPAGLGKKTRILDDLKTGPKEVTALRELAADIINEALADANSDIRVDHRSFKERGIEREPTTHLGPAASEIERRGEQSDRGDLNRAASDINATLDAVAELVSERATLTQAIEEERERLASPPSSLEDARERMREAVMPFARAIEAQGAVPDIEADGLSWWQRAGLRAARSARNLLLAISTRAKDYWQDRVRDDLPNHDRERGDGGLDR